MIFVTVGTHEQPFNRLIEEIDRLKGENAFEDEVIIQKGFSTYEPKHCKCFDMLPYEEMERYQKEARVIITHGGPASFVYPISIGKKPIVVPRQFDFNEHVNNHQLEFSKELLNRGFDMFVLEDIKDLKETIDSYSLNTGSSYVSHNKEFVCKMTEEVKKLFS